MKRILVATDGSNGADSAVDVAAALARDLGAELVVLAVAGDLAADDMRRLRHAEEDVGSALDDAAKRIAAAAAARASETGAGSVRSCIMWGEPAEAIMDEMRRSAAEMIVVGRRGRGRLTGLLLGSVSQKLVSLATCPVLVVP